MLGIAGGDSGTIFGSDLGSESDDSRYARPREAILIAGMIEKVIKTNRFHANTDGKMGWKKVGVKGRGQF